MRLDDCSILVSTADRGQAVIDRHLREDGKWWYRYRVVENVCPAANGAVCYSPIAHPLCDPLGLLELYTPEQLADYYDERTWLKMTTFTTYPDSVVTLTRHMLWQDNLKYRECEYAPDLVVTARPGWYFGTEATRGTTHGYPLADAMRATLFVSGPNIRRGSRVEEPTRLADLTPTLLEMTSTPYVASDMDGIAMRTIYESLEPAPLEHPLADAVTRPVYWEDIDLHAWQRLFYRERELYPHRPKSINRPACWLDMNNIAYNTLSAFDLNVWRICDTVLRPISKRPRLVSDAFDHVDRYCRDHCRAWFAQAVAVVDAPGIAVSDYSLTSIGNLKRADRAVDWLQARNKNLHAKLSRTGEPRTPGHRAAHHIVDETQESVWEVYRFAQRLLVQVLDETVLNSVENGVDRAINTFHQLPSEVRVE
jgi:hypothetical protein